MKYVLRVNGWYLHDVCDNMHHFVPRLEDAMRFTSQAGVDKAIEQIKSNDAHASSYKYEVIKI